jgi:hypothetical protein
MRPFYHKLFSFSRLSINYVLRRLFWFLFLLLTGLALGLMTGLFKSLTELKEGDALAILILGVSIPITFILWLVSMRAHRKRQKEEELHYAIEYLEELRDDGVISIEDFQKEKEKISKQYL